VATGQPAKLALCSSNRSDLSTSNSLSIRADPQKGCTFNGESPQRARKRPFLCRHLLLASLSLAQAPGHGRARGTSLRLSHAVIAGAQVSIVNEERPVAHRAHNERRLLPGSASSTGNYSVVIEVQGQAKNPTLGRVVVSETAR